LENLNLHIAAGEFAALTGQSGGGKTTLLKLILGLYEPTEGEILIDGQPLTPASRLSWRRNIGVVMQDDALLSGTIAENISFFDPQIDMERVQAAAMLAQIHDDIEAMPMKYLSMIGDMGSVLSGGQKQRVLLARALYKDPQILFLDEGTANLDKNTEKIIVDIIEDMDMTRVIVAHRREFLKRVKNLSFNRVGLAVVLFGDFGQSRESFRFVTGHVGQNFTVKLNTGLFKTVHKP